MNSKNVLIVGGSSGIGFATAKRLAASDWQVAIASRKPPNTEHHGLEWSCMDVTNSDSVNRSISEIHQKFSGLDAVVISASFPLFGAIEETTCEEAQEQFDVNFFGTHRVCQAVLPFMRSARKGTIMIIGSIAGLVPLAFQAFYCASKHAIEAYAECLRYELMNFGVRVVLVEPGDVRSEFTANRRIAKRTENSSSPYAVWAADCKKRIQNSEGLGQPPVIVARRIEQILNNNPKRFRYRISKPFEEFALFMRHWKMHSLYDFFALREFGLKDGAR